MSINLASRAALAGAAVLALSALAIPASAFAAGGPASAGGVCSNNSATPFLTITQPITEPDSATGGGNWANDTFTENAQVWLGTDGTTFCASGSVATGGAFTTTGPTSPQNGIALQSGITGSMTGGETWILPVGTATTTSQSSVTLGADNSASTGQFNNWQSQVLTNTAGASTFYFNYVASNGSTWTNADATSGGNSGDITPVYDTNTHLGYSTIAAAVAAAGTGDTIMVAPGTYSGDVTVSKANLTVESDGSGTVTLNLGSGYGFDLDEPGNVATGFTLKGLTVNASPSTTYAFKAYKADGLTLTNDIFNGGAGNTGGGVDINTTSNVTFNNVTSSGFHKNGFADTAAYTSADSSASGNGITFNGITASNNGWTGISFYTTGNSGGSASIGGVSFTGTNTISGNGQGIFIEGDTDAALAAATLPVNTVTSDGTTLNLGSTAFSGNTSYDIYNYQTAGVNALNASFSGTTGANMTASQMTTEDGLIYDALDNSTYGLVEYVAPSCTMSFNPTTTTDGSSTLSWACVKTDSTVSIDGGVGSEPSTGSTVVGIGTAGTFTYNLSTTAAGDPSVPVTASASVTATSGGGSTGGGGGSTSGGSSSAGSPGSISPVTPPVTPPSNPTTTTTTTTTTTNPGQVLGASTFNFTSDLWFHMKDNSDVAQLQSFLVAEGYSIPDATTDFFGNETLAAVKAFQKANGIPQTGYVGPLTRAVLNKGVISTTVETTTSTN
jgi:hypothetical protein